MTLFQKIELVQYLVTIIGFPVLIISILLMWKQTRAVCQCTMSQAYQNVVNHLIDMDRFFFENPEYKAYFYDGKDLSADADIVLQTRLLSIAELYMDIYDAMQVQKKFMPEYPWHTLEEYFASIFANSPIIRRFIESNKKWYPPELNARVQASIRLAR